MASAASSFGPFHFDPVEWRLTRDGVVVPLQDKVGVLIATLLTRPGGLWTREELFERLWPGVFVSDDALFQAVRKARQALSDDPRAPRWIETVQGRGYRFIGQVSPDAAPAEPRTVVSRATLGPDAGVRCRAPTGPILGRERELATLRAHLAEGARVVTLLGPAGAGKTTLASMEGAAREESARFVDLLAATDLDGVLHALGEGLGADSGGPDASAALLRALPVGDAALVVLDNAESCLRPLGRLLLDWLEREPQARFLVTSRRPLEIAAEQIVPVGPLSPGAAARVFRARAAARGVVLGDADSGLVQEVVAAVDGLPLALELAASRVGLLGLSTLLQRLRQPLELLRANRADLPERHRSIRAALELSWRALEPVEREFLAGVCVFRGPFRVDDAETVVTGPDWEGPDPLDLAQAVVDASLVRVVEGPAGERRLAPYVAVRELAFELVAPELVEAVRRRHLRWLASLSLGLDIGDEPSPAAHATLAPLLEDGAQALRFGVERGAGEEAARVAIWLVPLMSRRGAGLRAFELLSLLGSLDPLPLPLALALSTLEATVLSRGIAPERAPALFEAAAARAAEALPQAELSVLLCWANTTISRSVVAARPILERARLALARHPTEAGRAVLASMEAQLLAFDGDAAGARAGALAALDALRGLDRGWWVGRVMLDLAELDFHEHRFDDAERWVLGALQVYETAQANATTDHALSFLGAIRQGQGRHVEALALFVSLRAHARRSGNVQREQYLAFSAGNVLGVLGRAAEARVAFEEALLLARRQGNQVSEGWSLLRLAGCCWRLGQMDLGRARLAEAITCFSAAGRPVLAETARLELGRVALMSGDLEAAVPTLAEARQRLERLEQTPSRAALARALEAEARDRLGAPGAFAEAAAAVEVLRVAWPGEGLARGLCSLALIALSGGRTDAARALLKEAEGLREAVGDTDGDLARDVRRLREALETRTYVQSGRTYVSVATSAGER